MNLSTSSVPLFRFSTSVSGGSAIKAIRTSTGVYPFERKDLPAGLLHVGDDREAFKGLRKVSTTELCNACWPARKLLGVVRVVRTTSFQFESSMRGQGIRWRKIRK